NAVPASPRRKSGHGTRNNSQKRVSSGVESPVFDQVRERIYSEVASLVTQNETCPYYMLELIRVAQLLNTDYLRESGLSSLKRVINDYQNCDLIDTQAFSAIPQPPPPLLLLYLLHKCLRDCRWRGDKTPCTLPPRMFPSYTTT
ncbi:hypothetical protein LOD99_11472, partial [Oopsacas minuta]